MKKIVILIFFAILLVPDTPAQESSRNIKRHAFSGTLMFGAEAGMTIGLNDYSDIRPDLLGRGLLEYYFPTTSSGIFSIRGFATGGYVGGKDLNRQPKIFRTNFFNFGGGFSYTFSIEETVFPYVFLGGSYNWFDPKDENEVQLPGNIAGRYNKAEVNYHTEAGIRFLLTKAINLNFNIGAQWSPNDNWDDVTEKGNNDLMLTFMAGMSYSLFADTDTDGDGIPDSKDQCPETPANVRVDDFGCPLDSDRDGVPDYLDKCPNTKRGLEVDENGCPVDSDKDGVPNDRDKCPNTPAGVRVNENGCPDSDNDGVFDDRDKCADTPANAPVDDNGCPKDSDNDGVPDYKDKCPNTPAGEQVDENGCSTKPKVIKEPIVLSGDTNFEFNKSTLLPNAYPVLNKLAGSMKENPETRWRIEGHTDAVGSDQYNMKLSRERAQAVADYLASQGVDRSKLEVIPMGETQPVASNDSPEGRAMNRRVEIKIIEQ